MQVRTFLCDDNGGESERRSKREKTTFVVVSFSYDQRKVLMRCFFVFICLCFVFFTKSYDVFKDHIALLHHGSSESNDTFVIHFTSGLLAEGTIEIDVCVVLESDWNLGTGGWVGRLCVCVKNYRIISIVLQQVC